MMKLFRAQPKPPAKKAPSVRGEVEDDDLEDEAPRQVVPDTEIKKIILQGKRDVDWYNNTMAAAYMQAAATLKLAEEVSALRKLIQSGEGAFTVHVDDQPG